jgi:hypothetical protein
MISIYMEHVLTGTIGRIVLDAGLERRDLDTEVAWKNPCLLWTLAD